MPEHSCDYTRPGVDPWWERPARPDEEVDSAA